jgi:hypothetical protein
MAVGGRRRLGGRLVSSEGLVGIGLAAASDPEREACGILARLELGWRSGLGLTARGRELRG